MRICAAISALFVGLICGCANPLAPGYKIQKESLTVHFVTGNPPHLAIRAEYALVNIGNAPLNFIAIALPDEKHFGCVNVRAEIDGKEIAPQLDPGGEDAGAESPILLRRISFPVPWRQKTKAHLTLAYDLAGKPATDPRIFVAAGAFYLNDSGWFPVLPGFKALLAPRVVRPDPMDLTVIVPADFRATAGGQLRNTKKQNGEVESRFRIRKTDFDPYVIAGQYYEQRVSTPAGGVVIWTFKPISPIQVQKTAPEIAEAVRFDSQTFGPLPRSMKAIYDVELPSDVPDLTIWRGFLPGVIYNAVFESKKSFGTAMNNGLLQDFEQLKLGYTWFGHMIRPRSDASLLGVELAIYSYAGLNKNQDTETSRAERIRSALDDYDNARIEATEKPIVSLNFSDPEEQLTLGVHKMSLFFAALEDKCGQQNVIHAITHMVYALRGEEYGYPEFRAAVEQQCHQDLAGFFHQWLTQPGIPPDFRARYENASGNQR